MDEAAMIRERFCQVGGGRNAAHLTPRHPRRHRVDEMPLDGLGRLVDELHKVESEGFMELLDLLDIKEYGNITYKDSY